MASGRVSGLRPASNCQAALSALASGRVSGLRPASFSSSTQCFGLWLGFRAPACEFVKQHSVLWPLARFPGSGLRVCQAALSALASGRVSGLRPASLSSSTQCFGLWPGFRAPACEFVKQHSVLWPLAGFPGSGLRVCQAALSALASGRVSGLRPASFSSSTQCFGLWPGFRARPASLSSSTQCFGLWPGFRAPACEFLKQHSVLWPLAGFSVSSSTQCFGLWPGFRAPACEFVKQHSVLWPLAGVCGLRPASFLSSIQCFGLWPGLRVCQAALSALASGRVSGLLPASFSSSTQCFGLWPGFRAPACEFVKQHSVLWPLAGFSDSGLRVCQAALSALASGQVECLASTTQRFGPCPGCIHCFGIGAPGRVSGRRSASFVKQHSVLALACEFVTQHSVPWGLWPLRVSHVVFWHFFAPPWMQLLAQSACHLFNAIANSSCSICLLRCPMWPF